MKTKYSSVVVDAAYQRLHTEVFEQHDSLADIISACESTEGDPSHIPGIAQAVRDKLIVGEPLLPIDRIWLAWILDRVIGDEATARAVSGKEGRGKPKNGARSFRVAADVLDHILIDESTTSVPKAWEKVAERHHLSVERVRECWAERKVDVCCSRESELRLRDDVEIDDAIAAVLKGRREKQRISPPGGE